ncbi:PREDICTED: uncharacterized protein LOC108575180 [Habropoda laboriosa]|uniref:uncharacterized protein LOC108575180 n=1 Tax=Habropoda laboriosa TaxID=597456 RepID=UPI00083D35AB|nr:PREDICTED: uncharacterized protein LOC108575180 [Habropoda laboriosa]
MQNPVVKKHRNKRKTFWCAPRKVKSIHTAEDADNSPMKNVKSKKKSRKKKRKIMKKLRRIDILAQPKFVKDKPELKNRSSNVNSIPLYHNFTTLQIILMNICDRLRPKNFTLNPTLKDSSPIVLPKNIGFWLMSLVQKRIKKLTNSENL